MPFDPGFVTLEGRHVRLEPLDESHASDLLEFGADDALWPYMPRGPFADADDVVAWIREARAAAEAGAEVPFAIVPLDDGRAVGSTRYMDIRRPHRGLEIGYTWVARSHQRTVVNTECKYLLLEHAFERLGAIRVQLKTDARNVQSRRAIERVGGVQEGVLRSHMFMWDGAVRDSVYYSIVAGEWPAVKASLRTRLRG